MWTQGSRSTLRWHLIAIVVGTITTVLVLVQWVNTRLSERTLKQDLQERALLVLETVDSLWGRASATEFQQRLSAIVSGDRDVAAIDVYTLHGQNLDLDTTTRADDERAAAGLPQDSPLRQIATSHTLTMPLPDRDGSGGWRVAIPLRREGDVVGAAQVEMRPFDITRLTQRLRVIDAAMLIASIVAISLLLTVFLDRRVARPVTALVAGMRRAESGELGVRVPAWLPGEFGFLTTCFNRMLSRIEELTGGLEERVRAATADLKEKNRALLDANERLWRAQLEIAQGERLATLGQMAGTLAHELGTPLNSVSGYIQLLLHEELQTDQREKLGIVESQVQRMIETIRSVLDRTRDVPLRRGPVALHSLASEALALVSAQAAARGLTMRMDVPADLPDVQGDAHALRQVLLNLLTNAIDATNAGGSVTVAGSAVPGDGRTLEVAVTDTGHGMSPDEVRCAFEPFYTTKAPGRGTGLGLVIVDHLVRAHGGSVLIDSTPGRGTTMRIRLPLEG